MQSTLSFARSLPLLPALAICPLFLLRAASPALLIANGDRIGIGEPAQNLIGERVDTYLKTH
jgi:hypothetical protein